jgi:hypothetical protein
VADKRGRWSKKERDLIWKSYVDDREYIISCMNDIGISIDFDNYNFSQEAPCPFCGELMLKAQYQGAQMDKWASWDIDHIDGNSNNNNLNNLQPMHPWCNKEKE